jgi:transcriptional regulator with XRE-family HTH domain
VEEEISDYEGPFLVAAGTPGNHRFGVLVNNLRERSSLSPQELAEQADVHVSFVRGIERGAQAPSVATARTLLACMKEQHLIEWVGSGPFDLLVRDPGSGRNVAFEFKAKVKGQNRRTDVLAGPRAGLEALVQAFQQLGIEQPVIATAGLEALAQRLQQLGIEQPVGDTRELRADVDEHAGDGQPRRSAPADDAALGRVVRLLAVADGESLARVESLLREEVGPGQSGFSPIPERSCK